MMKQPMYGSLDSNPITSNPVRVQSLSTMVYKLKKGIIDLNKKKDELYLSEDRISFKAPPKYYGDTLEKSKYMFTYFINTPGSTGIFLVGEAGSGKTLMAETICNIGLENNFPVIYISSIEVGTNEIQFLSTLNNCVILIDEYSKIFNYYQQKYFLSLLTDKSKKILWLLTDNSTADVNAFMLSRPGRIRYRLRFGKLDRKVFEGYIKDHNLDPIFEEELRDAYNSADKFTFDHLEALVSEHHFCPSLSIKEMIEIMNIDNLDTKAVITVARVEYLGKEIPYIYLDKDNKLVNNFISQPLNINMVGSRVPLREYKYGDEVDTYTMSIPLEDIYKPINSEFAIRSQESWRSKNNKTFTSRSAFSILIKEPARLKVKLLPMIKNLTEEQLKELGNPSSQNVYIEDLDESTLKEFLRIDPFSLASRTLSIDSIRTISKTKDKDLIYDDLVGVVDGYKDPKGGYLLHYKNKYFSIYFNLSKVEGYEPLVIDKIL